MNVDVVFASIAFSDLEAAQAWSERLFHRSADVVAHQKDVIWQVSDRG